MHVFYMIGPYKALIPFPTVFTLQSPRGISVGPVALTCYIFEEAHISYDTAYSITLGPTHTACVGTA